MSASSALIVSLDGVTAGWGRPVLEDVSWRLRAGELWAIVGPNASGKSSLLSVLRGRIPVTGGTLRYGPHARGRAVAGDPEGQMLSVSFAAQADLLERSAGYAQSRWHGGQDEAVRRGSDVLGPVLDAPECRRIVDALALGPLLDRRVTELSNGERRKLVLARAAGRHPAILALDNPLNGLDASARDSVREAVEALHREETTLLMVTSRADEIPGTVTHVLLLDDGRVVMSGLKEAVLGDDRFAALMRPEPRTRGSASRSTVARRSGSGADAPAVVELHDAELTYGTSDVLRGVSWTVRRGERWVVVGPNGAGKSALLSLILADNPQAYANDVSLFGRRRGSGDTIWDIRRRIGSVSPEMHLYQELDHRVLDVIGSGMLDPVGARRDLTGQERRAVEACMCALDLERCRDRRLRDLSEGELQATLLARALAKGAELLVLDEPCQGLDASRRARFLELLEHRLHAGDTTLIYVTHDLDEVPASVTHGLLLRRGRSALQGPAEEVLGAYRADLAGHAG
ncbi:MAG: ATP-binding cassette domain-containing protein [Gemmatimonadales bacterium]